MNWKHALSLIFAFNAGGYIASGALSPQKGERRKYLAFGAVQGVGAVVLGVCG